MIENGFTHIMCVYVLITRTPAIAESITAA